MNEIFHGTLSRSQFLAEYWQQRPLLMRGAVDPGCLQFSAEELAGLACEHGVESRLISHSAKQGWQLRLGPFDEQDFAALPESDWTLLVQDVDKYVPEVEKLLEQFDFLPDWRIDDIMISFAADGGGVGPHTDNYDVFLVQAQGQRRWRLSTHSYNDADLLADCPLRVLKHFHTCDDWVLNPGDVLYLPPRLAHWGTAIGDCVTWSVGMRGISSFELAQAWLQHQVEHADACYLEDNLAGKVDPSRLDEQESSRVLQLIDHLSPQQTPAMRRWLGALMTEPKSDFEISPRENPLTPNQLQKMLETGTGLKRHPWARFATLQIDSETFALCCQGECWERPSSERALLDWLCTQRSRTAENILHSKLAMSGLKQLTELINKGWLIPDA